MEKEKNASLRSKVVLVFGRICSGKGGYGKDPMENARVIVSDLVKTFVKSADRSALQNTLEFDQAIADMILKRIKMLEEMNLWHNIIVDGIRQISIVERVLQQYPNAELVWIEAPTEERKRRYYNRKDIKDVEDFDIADNKPIELECQKIFDILKDKLTIINNY